jgi:NADH dehydrogenase
MAVIGKAKAVAHLGRHKVGGLLAWLLWGGVHIAFLIGFRNRMQVLLSWFWNWLLNARDARLITGEARLEIEVPRPAGFVASGAETKLAGRAGADGSPAALEEQGSAKVPADDADRS